VDLDRSLTHAEFVRDHLVRLAGDDEVEYLALPVGEPGDSFFHLGVLLLLLSAFPVRPQRFANTVQQVLVTEWLLDEIDGAFLHRFDRHGHVAMPGDEDHRQRIAALDQLLLELQTTESRHAYVEHQAPGPLIRNALEKLVAGPEDLVLEIDGVHKGLHCETNGRVIVDDEHGRGLLRLWNHTLPGC
jgi:hypothetical protein